MSEVSQEKLSKLIEKYDSMKKQEKMDLSSDQDLSIAIMNLISIEEHLIFSGAKTGKSHFYALVPEIREMRKNLLKMLIKEYEGEVWCISKHLLAGSMRLMEVGTKAQSMGKMDQAESFFEKAYDLYSLFWGLQMNVVNADTLGAISKDEEVSKKEVQEIQEEGEIVAQMSAEQVETPRKGGFMGKLGDLVRKAVDCCIE